jgi:hypothetical protein
MGKVTKKEMPMWAQSGHGKPVTRREFLAHGLIPFAASAFLPSVLGLLTPMEARAATCASSASGMIPFITLNLAGGAGLSSNYAPRLASGDPLASYTKMGLGDNTGANALEFESEFGVAGFPKQGATMFSQLLVGIRANCDPATLANTAFLALCVQSQDDTSNNRFDVSGLVYKSGLVGSLMPNIGTQSTATGTQMSVALAPPPRPMVVSNYGVLSSAIAYTRSLTGTNGLNTEQQGKLARLVASLSDSQAQKLAQVQSVAGVKDIIECAGIKNAGLITNGAPAGINPSGNADILARWGLNTGSFTPAAGSQDVVFSTAVYNALLGQAGSVGLTIGGYDYHNGTRTTGNQKDNEAGRAIGRILDTARLLGKKAFLYVNSDGSVVSREDATPGTGVWTSDRGNAGLAMIFMYDPAGRPQTTGSQIGSFTDGQSVDTTSPIGNSAEKAAVAVFANYLKLNNRMDLYSKVVTTSQFNSVELNSVIKVG